MDSKSFALASPAIGIVVVGSELFFDLVRKLSRRIVSIAQLYIASSHMSMEAKKYIVTVVAL
jgi:hypothetical protein